MNIAKIGRLLFSIAGIAAAAFALCVFFMDSDVAIWRAFAVLMPITGICFTGGAVLLIIDHIRKR